MGTRALGREVLAPWRYQRMSLFVNTAFILPDHSRDSRVWDTGLWDCVQCLSFPSGAWVGQFRLPSCFPRSAEPTRQALGWASPDGTDLQKPKLSNKTQRILSCGRQTCSPGPCPPALPAMELIPGWGHRVPTQRGVGQSMEEWRSAPNTHLEQFLFLPFETSDLSPWSSRLGLCLHGWVGGRKDPGRGNSGMSGMDHLFFCPPSFPETLSGCPQLGGQKWQAWPGEKWEHTGLPNKGLSETKILWDATHPPSWKLTEKKRTSGEKPVKWE